jgi:hypothetical protein
MQIKKLMLKPFKKEQIMLQKEKATLEKNLEAT